VTCFITGGEIVLTPDTIPADIGSRMAPRLFSRISSKRGYRPHRYMLIRYRYVPSYVVYCMAMTITITITMSTFLPPLASKGRKKG